MNQNNEREISINMHRNNEIKCDSFKEKGHKSIPMKSMMMRTVINQ